VVPGIDPALHKPVHARAAPTRRLPSGRQDFARSWTNLTANSEGAVTSFWDFDWGAALERGASGGGFPDETIFATAYGAGRGPYPDPVPCRGGARGPPASALVPLGLGGNSPGKRGSCTARCLATATGRGRGAARQGGRR